MAGQGGGFTTDAFHQVAVATESENLVVENLEAGTVKVPPQPLARNSHAHAIAHTLTQRTGASFHARGQSVFGMSRSLAINLTKSLDVIQRDREFAQVLVFGIHAANSRQVQHGVEQHGRGT